MFFNLHSDSPQNEDVTVFEKSVAEVGSKAEPSENNNTEVQPLSLSEEKSEETYTTLNVSESISLNEDSLMTEKDHVDDNMADSANTNIEWKSLSESPLSSSISDISKPRELKTTCKGDMVVVGSLAGSPSSDTSDILKGKIFVSNRIPFSLNYHFYLCRIIKTILIFVNFFYAEDISCFLYCFNKVLNN